MNAIGKPLADLLLRLDGARTQGLERAVLRLAEALGEGHVCLPPGEFDDAVRASNTVGGEADFTPLVLDDGRLYLRRYFDYETRLAAALRKRAAESDAKAPAALVKKIAMALKLDASQSAAVESAARLRLCVITGGPGTGKTRTAAAAVAVLAEMASEQGQRLHFTACAPTGKAAARLGESLAQTLDDLPLSDAARAMLPREAVTLHRLLGSRPDSPDARHNASNPLPADVIVLDEASMVALPMMARLFAALVPGARVLLLGDKDQLASVEAGHVLDDLCTADTLCGCVAELQTNHRFAAGSGIAELSRLVKAGDADAVLRLPASATMGTRALPPRAEFSRELAARAVDGFRACAGAASPDEALRKLGDFRILCALRDGPQGVVNFNRLAEQSLADAGLISPDRTFYAGRPLLVQRNDYELRLFNGDMGIVLPDESGELRAFFPDESGGVRAFAPSRLPEHETAFAMTVHKAQGSEFARVLFVLPERDSQVVSRELLYTGITRAREHVELWWSEAALRAGIARRVERWSGLGERLRG